MSTWQQHSNTTEHNAKYAHNKFSNKNIGLALQILTFAKQIKSFAWKRVIIALQKI